MNRPWQDSPTVYIVEEILKKVLKPTKQFIGLLIATILGIIAMATIAAVAGVALHQSVWTVHFVQEWHKDSDVLWYTQRQTDGKLAAQMADSQQVAILQGDQVNSLQKQIRVLSVIGTLLLFVSVLTNIMNLHFTGTKLNNTS